MSISEGEGSRPYIRRNFDRRLSDWKQAAEQAYAIAQSNLGWCYDAGCGVAQDETEAVRWYRKAALQNDETAQFNLGVHYEWGSGVAEDKVEAAEWYRKAAEQGYEKAGEALKKLTDKLAEAERDRAEKTAEAELKFRTACKEALADGKLTVDEKHELKTLAESFNISTETMKKLFDEEKKIFFKSRKVQRARDAELKFRIACKNALGNGKVSIDEKHKLKTLAKSLKMSNEAMKQILKNEVKIFRQSHPKKHSG